MQVKSLVAFGVIGLVAYAGLKGRKAEQAEIQKIAVEQKLSANETMAFRSCVSDMSSKQLTQKSDKGSVTLSSVPKEICVCQAREMAKILKPEQFGENAKAVKLFGESDKVAALTNLVAGADQASERALKLSLSLAQCLSDFKAKRDALQTEALTKARQSNPAIARSLAERGL